MFTLQNNATNTLRFNQTFIGANDMKWIITQKSNNIDYPIFNFRNGNIVVGTTSNPGYRIDLIGDINITGSYRVNSTIYKPANTVLADTSTSLATSRNIAGTPFNGTNDIDIDYNVLNNRPFILFPLQPNNLYFTPSGNLGIGFTSGTAGHKIDVVGDINCSGVFRVGGVAQANSWLAGTPSTNIHYTAGNVGIGTNTSTTARLNILGDTQIFSPVITPTIPVVLSITPTPRGRCYVISHIMWYFNGWRWRLWR
jgi:hypothetical protein